MTINGFEITKDQILAAIMALFFLAFGLFLGKKIWQPKTVTVIEKAEPAIKQKDGSTVLERKETDPKAKAATDLPPGSKLKRKIQVVVRPPEPSSDNAPKIPNSNASGLVGPGGENPSSETKIPSRDVTVDISVVEMPDGTTRVVGKTSDGSTIISGLDQPVEPVTQVKPQPNALHIAYRPSGTGYGVLYTRDFLKRFIAGVQLQMIQDPGIRGMRSEAWVSLGYRW
jgi:hypothetical protein